MCLRGWREKKHKLETQTANVKFSYAAQKLILEKKNNVIIEIWLTHERLLMLPHLQHWYSQEKPGGTS